MHQNRREFVERCDYRCCILLYRDKFPLGISDSWSSCIAMCIVWRECNLRVRESMIDDVGVSTPYYFAKEHAVKRLFHGVHGVLRMCAKISGVSCLSESKAQDEVIERCLP